MSIYTKTDTDFKNEEPNNISLHQLKYDIACTISNPLLYAIHYGTTFSCCFTDPLSGTDETVFNSLIENYKTREFNNDIVTLKDIKTVGTNGGTFTQDVWTTRIINSITGNADFVSLVMDGENYTGEFALIEGTYDIIASCPAAGVYNHRCKLYDITHSTDVDMGSNDYSSTSNTNSILYTNIEVGYTTTYAIQHMCSKTVNDSGLGLATGFGGDEVYTIIRIRKIK